MFSGASPTLTNFKNDDLRCGCWLCYAHGCKRLTCSQIHGERAAVEHDEHSWAPL